MDRNELAIQALKDIKIHPKQKKETRFEFGLMIALETLEKQIPKKALDIVNGDGSCPNCKEHVYYFQKHCCNCGQKFSWEE